MTITLAVTPYELEYLRRAVTRDLEEFDAESMMVDMEEYAILEASNATRMLELLGRVAQESVYPH